MSKIGYARWILRRLLALILLDTIETGINNVEERIYGTVLYLKKMK